MTKRTTVKLMFAAAVASVLPLIVTVMGPLEIFLNNKQEFLFRVGDFLPVTSLLGLILFAVLFALLAVLRKKAFLVALAVIAWLSLMTFLQATFLNFGLDTLAATTGEDAVTIEDVIEPYLMQLGFIMRTPRGRICTQAAYDHMKIPMPVEMKPRQSEGQTSLLD